MRGVGGCKRCGHTGMVAGPRIALGPVPCGLCQPPSMSELAPMAVCPECDHRGMSTHRTFGMVCPGCGWHSCWPAEST